MKLYQSIKYIGLITLFLSGVAQAQTLTEALVQAYHTNPTLEGERAALNATQESLTQAKAGYLPQIGADASTGFAYERLDSYSSNTTPTSLNLSLSQPIFRGGRTVAAIRRSRSIIKAEEANLHAQEQQVLLDAATAYLDTVRDQAVVSLNQNNEQVLKRQFEAARERFKLGQITRTDVSQAEARLARSTADRIAAEGQLSATQAVYTRIIGNPPGDLKQPDGTTYVHLPTSLEQTIDKAATDNPALIIAQYNEEAAQQNVNLVAGERWPEISLEANAGRDWQPSPLYNRSDSASVLARVHIPLYQGGSVTSRIREAKFTANQRRLDIEVARRNVQEQAVRAWEALLSARAEKEARQSQVRAASLALEGVREEAKLGSRTTLDVLNSEQEHLDAQVSLVTAERDEAVAIFQVLAAIGQMTAEGLQLSLENTTSLPSPETKKIEVPVPEPQLGPTSVPLPSPNPPPPVETSTTPLPLNKPKPHHSRPKSSS